MEANTIPNITSVVHITDLGKYVIVVETSLARVDDKFYKDLAVLKKMLTEWWLGNDKFMVVVTGPSFGIRFERLEGEDDQS